MLYNFLRVFFFLFLFLFLFKVDISFGVWFFGFIELPKGFCFWWRRREKDEIEKWWWGLLLIGIFGNLRILNLSRLQFTVDARKVLFYFILYLQIAKREREREREGLVGLASFYFVFWSFMIDSVCLTLVFEKWRGWDRWTGKCGTYVMTALMWLMSSCPKNPCWDFFFFFFLVKCVETWDYRIVTF